MLAQHGITLRTIDDTQLMSYVLDAGAQRAWRSSRWPSAGSAMP